MESFKTEQMNETAILQQVTSRETLSELPTYHVYPYQLGATLEVTLETKKSFSKLTETRGGGVSSYTASSTYAKRTLEAVLIQRRAASMECDPPLITSVPGYLAYVPPPPVDCSIKDELVQRQEEFIIECMYPKRILPSNVKLRDDNRPLSPSRIPGIKLTMRDIYGPERSPSSQRGNNFLKRRSPSPIRRRRSRSGSRFRSRSRSRSPKARQRSNSPRMRLASPRMRTPSPRLRLTSPRMRTPSPRLRLASPRLRTPSPRLRLASPRMRTPSPRQRLNSPRLRSPSPRIKKLSPRKRSPRLRSPRLRSPSPRIRLLSPRRSPYRLRLLSTRLRSPIRRRSPSARIRPLRLRSLSPFLVSPRRSRSPYLKSASPYRLRNSRDSPRRSASPRQKQSPILNLTMSLAKTPSLKSRSPSPHLTSRSTDQSTSSKDSDLDRISSEEEVTSTIINIKCQRTRSRSPSK